MNVTTVSTGTSTGSINATQQTTKTYKIEMLDDGQLSMASDDDDDDLINSDDSIYDDADLAHITVQDDVATQLAAAGPVGVAAAAAIASSKKRKRAHSFETNPSVRKRQQNRLLRKLRGIIYEFTGRVGKQAVVLVATPGKPNTSYKVFGAKPLEDVVRNLKNIVMDELENALAQQAPPPPQDDPSLFELPPLIIDGIPTPVEKMTQAQLRAFIPLMLKYSTGRGKPGWGRESTRPPWWPKELPWANVRMDARSEDDKQKISWTHALRKIVINCYKYHGREDLLPTFADDEDKIEMLEGEEDDEMDEHEPPTSTTIQTVANASTNTTNYTTQTVLSTIQNADGTVSLIQVDPNNPIITLPDGTTAQVQGVATLHQGEGGATIQTVQSLGDVNGHENMTVDLTEATVAQDGQIYITAEDGQGYPVSVSNMITVPVSASMYQSMMANIQQIHTNGDGTVCITPMQVDSRPNSSNSRSNNHNTNNITNSSRNHFQCYTLTAAPGGLGARLIATAPTSALPSTANQSQTNLANNNATNCQIFNQCNLSNNTSSQISRADHSQHHQQRQQQLQAISGAAKIFINAASFATINNNNSLNTNNNNKFGNLANAAAVVPLSLPIMVATAGVPTATCSANSNGTNGIETGAGGSGANVTTTRTAGKKGAHKRRKQTFGKAPPVKQERCAAETLLQGNINFLDDDLDNQANGSSVSDNVLNDEDDGGAGDGRGSEANRNMLGVGMPGKSIKTENLEN
ncbi:DNA-binding protein Ewg isoform X6 [Bactrocera oleae]|uniref:DNA-binding protein Ewg isoform X6 n=1 Tax=Bactrocera oleae TaxID=104688 RepID=UPI0006B85A54|nr:DNA-binding protein Ewg isoform X6 [Bactrocera oleae]XP_036227820.1 DNA-binding protein Ewg isoform X6 [Bactrocera oleae]XP_036227821.1 DNA-binding protein Ewg isoform X6 [Bactrocera oleae]